MTWFNATRDRRLFPRFRAEIPLIASIIGDREIRAFHATADGISQDGLSIAGLTGLGPGEPISLEIHLPIARESIWLEAVVRHSGGHCGLQFSGLTRVQRELINRYCRLQPRQKCGRKPRHP